jgi:biopolymer transport protein ExbD
MKHGRTQGDPSVRANSDINVTPLVDIVLVLLIIFMVVTPLLEKDILVRVPDSTQEPTASTSPDQIVVHVKNGGKIDVNWNDVADDEYVAALKKTLDPRQESDRVVFFVAENEANYGRLVWAVDAAKSAGAGTIGIATTAQ